VVGAPPDARRRRPRLNQRRPRARTSWPPVPLIGRNDRLAAVGVVPGRSWGMVRPSRSGLHRGRRSCPHRLVPAASSSEPPTSVGLAQPSSRSLAAATREASHRGTRRGREENDVDLALCREAVEDGRVTLKTCTPPAAGRTHRSRRVATRTRANKPLLGRLDPCEWSWTVQPSNSTCRLPFERLWPVDPELVGQVLKRCERN